MRRTRTNAVLITAALAALTGCQSTQTAATPVALGAGDSIGHAVRTNEILLTDRQAWDKDQIRATEAVRLAEAIRRLDQDGSGQIANEPILLDAP